LGLEGQERPKEAQHGGKNVRVKKRNIKNVSMNWGRQIKNGKSINEKRRRNGIYQNKVNRKIKESVKLNIGKAH